MTHDEPRWVQDRKGVTHLATDTLTKGDRWLLQIACGRRIEYAEIETLPELKTFHTMALEPLRVCDGCQASPLGELFKVERVVMCEEEGPYPNNRARGVILDDLAKKLALMGYAPNEGEIHLMSDYTYQKDLPKDYLEKLGTVPESITDYWEAFAYARLHGIPEKIGPYESVNVNYFEKPWPTRGHLGVFVVTGGSEGHWFHVEQKGELIALGKDLSEDFERVHQINTVVAWLLQA